MHGNPVFYSTEVSNILLWQSRKQIEGDQSSVSSNSSKSPRFKYGIFPQCFFKDAEKWDKWSEGPWLCTNISLFKIKMNKIWNNTSYSHFIISFHHPRLCFLTTKPMWEIGKWFFKRICLYSMKDEKKITAEAKEIIFSTHMIAVYGHNPCYLKTSYPTHFRVITFNPQTY